MTESDAVISDTGRSIGSEQPQTQMGNSDMFMKPKAFNIHAKQNEEGALEEEKK